MKMLKSLQEFEQEGSSMNRNELIQIKGGSTQSQYKETGNHDDIARSQRLDRANGEWENGEVILFVIAGLMVIQRLTIQLLQNSS